MTHPDPEIRAQYEADRAMERRQREVLLGETRSGREFGIAVLWRRLPSFVRLLIVVGAIFVAGWSSAVTVLPLNAERTLYKQRVDEHALALDTLRGVINPFARYMLCWTARQEDARPAAGCDRSLIGTPLWRVLQEERREIPR
jgi:hypothetical protein